MKRLAIIPARSGSRGLKDKNILLINNKPLMSYTIEAAEKSRMFDKILVSSDSDYYGEIALQYNAIFHKRNKQLSGDDTPTYDVIKDILDKENDYDYFVLLQPTSPLRDEKDIQNAIEYFENNIEKYDFLASVFKAHKSSVLINEIDEDHSLKNFKFDAKNYKRQKYNEYETNGAIFIGKPQEYLKEGSFFGEKSLGFIMDKTHSIEIDDIYDFNYCVSLLNNRKDD